MIKEAITKLMGANITSPINFVIASLPFFILNFQNILLLRQEIS